MTMRCQPSQTLAESDYTQGYHLVIGTVTLPVGVCLLPRSGWHRIPASFQSDEERVCEWNLSLRCYDLPEARRARIYGTGLNGPVYITLNYNRYRSIIARSFHV